VERVAKAPNQTPNTLAHNQPRYRHLLLQ